MTKIIMFVGGIETSEYFTLQLSKTFQEMGHEVFLYQLQEEDRDFPSLCNFIEDGNTAVITFNFHGLNFERPFYNNNRFFWEIEDIPCYNIVLDHPFYYHKFLEAVPPQYVNISIDREHELYMKRYFPSIRRGPFLPLAGTEIFHKPYMERSKDIVFTGNYTPPGKFDKYITRIDDEYTDFYRSIIKDLITHPDLGMDEVFEIHLIREMDNPSDEDLKLCMENMIFIDLYVRFHFRGLVVKTLVDSGFKVHVYGAGWELLECTHPENLIIYGPKNSLGCLEAIADGKISLNVMPWFKDGAHDRIFNSMLNGALCLSDDSTWLRKNLKDRTEIVYYSLSEIEKLPDIVEGLLKNPEYTGEIIQNGYRKAKALHTWECRAKLLNELIETDQKDFGKVSEWIVTMK